MPSLRSRDQEVSRPVVSLALLLLATSTVGCRGALTPSLPCGRAPESPQLAYEGSYRVDPPIQYRGHEIGAIQICSNAAVCGWTGWALGSELIYSLPLGCLTSTGGTEVFIQLEDGARLGLQGAPEDGLRAVSGAGSTYELRRQ